LTALSDAILKKFSPAINDREYFQIAREHKLIGFKNVLRDIYYWTVTQPVSRKHHALNGGNIGRLVEKI
jgi:hypothetical protein